MIIISSDYILHFDLPNYGIDKSLIWSSSANFLPNCFLLQDFYHHQYGFTITCHSFHEIHFHLHLSFHSNIRRQFFSFLYLLVYHHHIYDFICNQDVFTWKTNILSGINLSPFMKSSTYSFIV